MATLSTNNITPAHQLGDNVRGASLQAGKSSSAASYIPSGNTTVTLNFFKPPEDGSKPYNFVDAPKDGQPQRNFGATDIDVQMNDMRGKESSFTLDKDAFAVTVGVPESAEKDFTDDESIKRNYYPELEKLILDSVPGSTRVVFFDHTVRRAQPNSHRAPVTRVHVDQTAQSAKARVYQHTGDDAEKLLQGRYRIINVWRPLNGPVQSFPLAVASSSSVDASDLVPIEHRYPDRTGETAGVLHGKNQKWYYLSGMRNDERLFLECFDSEALKQGSKVQGGRAPHTAFVDPRTPEGAPGRESIEVRTLVFGP